MATLNTQKWKDYYEPYKAEKKQATAAGYDAQKQTVSDTYNLQIKETESDYSEQYRNNAVQKLINEREVAESMSDMGLTDSGLNRTQQTAVQLSYANNKAKIDRQKNSMVDSLRLQLTADLSEIETNKANALTKIDDDYATLATSAAQDEYETALKYETEVAKARISAEKAKSTAAAKNDRSNIVYTYSGYDGNKGMNVYLGNDGKTYYFAEGLNPYTGANNTALLGEGEVKGKGVPTTGSDAQKGAYVYGVFSNGYQPKGVYSSGTNYGAVKNSNQKLSDNRTVWYTNTRYGVHYWIWSGYNNSYIEVAAAGTDENGNTQWVAV